MKKKWIFIALFVLIAALALAACGGGKEAAEAPKATEAPAEQPKATEAAPAEQPTKEVSEDLTCDDPLGCVTIGPDDPVRIGYALVLSGPNESLGVDSRRGIAGDGGYRVLLESVKRHGKLFFVEIDPST
ncbi:MAG TPA: hypothetical protein EYP25_05130, partial [Anaerolineae bacterium]|nr:hypothetical protein [Anaerolineae bacterium]